ncbi:two component transcriptional regulator, LytTR family [Mitsuaria sp. PDC51]|uniref:LytR/AlgR family response regulator transcription factor n=1 Tax=unclassified Roseateles TaxID=2626991 RepID=UPI0008EF0998|nr:MULTISPECIES: LytTR family DNA-binding domain-containing protein [unclassified Roseateles]MBB3294196.1 DNA-binding LytR/AlgR family response regulator [Mitsuaria sp. BK041]MBB3363413.1 DNA-binding LytR/AlgR family response regulator [Mitsuaria sp. BK045]SFR97959.1 two component transcriptional regulator, LytTR family [Mitsuaria sp. PDC51]
MSAAAPPVSTASTAPTALIADDEPLLRDSLQRSLALLWPELRVVAQARNGREAVEMFELHRPDIAFLDVHMPGVNGMEAARQIARQAQVVFVTAFEEYALQAFERGAIDYLVKPVDEARLADTIGRLKERLGGRPGLGAAHPAALEAVIDELSRRMARAPALSVPAGGALAADTGPLQWIRASVGSTLKLIPVDEILFLRSDEKYTLVVTAEGEALIRTPIRELIERLDPQRFVQVHRSVVVNLHAISHVTRGPNETADLHLKARPEVLPVSRSYLHLFRQM